MTTSRLSRKVPPSVLHQLQAELFSARAEGAAPEPDGVPAPFLSPHVAMRDPHRPVAPARAPALPAAGVVVHNRLAYGPRPGDLQAFQALGGSDSARLSAWLDEQLDPSSIDDSALDARISALGFTTLGKSLPQLWLDHMINYVEWEDHIRPIEEITRLKFVRAIWSRRQLFEVMAEFWHDHFSVHAWEFAIAPVWVHTDRDAIRPHALGNFRQMLEAVTRTPSMLFYLDNAENSLEDPNENFARELLELHTLGSDAYYGSIDPADVPRDGANRPLGYTEFDVVEVARALTGWTVSARPWDENIGNTGEFLYYDPWHDHDPKTVIGMSLPANQPPMQDGRDIFDLLAEHPATGRFVAGKLCRRLFHDFPPQEVVDAAAATFTAQAAAADQIAQVVRVIVEHPLWLQTWGEKVKRPFEVLASHFRGAQGELEFQIADEGNSDWLNWMFYQTGHYPFNWAPPNGYPDVRAAWNSTSPRVMTWRVANMLVQAYDDVADRFAFDFLGQTPANVRSAEEIVDFWTGRLLSDALPSDERQSLIAFMAQGHNPGFDLPLAADEETQDRLRTLGAILAMTPSFLWR
ncbi:MAG: DUF1800 domain-containing protein [Acidobacteriota bacterium]